MKNNLFFLLLMTFSLCAREKLRFLHLSFHRGCIEEIEQVARDLSIDLTSWFIFSHIESYTSFFPNEKISYDIYNMTNKKAKKIWESNKHYFQQFDAIITSDTTPLSRIFIQNNWKKPLIIWVCNRFDLRFDHPECNFPDKEYYELIQQAAKQPNVTILSYTPYEYVYAQSKGVYFGNQVIKPIGKKPQKFNSKKQTFFKDINKKEYVYISPIGGAIASKAFPKNTRFVLDQLDKVNIKACAGPYNGPDDLTDFKGIIHFPYQASVFSLFEEIQRGIVHFVPSKKFLDYAVQSENQHMPCKTIGHSLTSFEDSEWYLKENKDYCIYFDSWQDLKSKIDTVDYQKMKKGIINNAIQHRKTMLKRWKAVFQNAQHYLQNQGLI